MNPSQTLREIASIAQTPEVRARLIRLADEFEAQHNAQNGQWAIVFGRLENNIADQLEAMRFDLTQELGHSEARQNKMLEMLEALQGEIQSIKASDANGG